MKNKVFYDIILNTFASGLPIISIQLCILPIIAKEETVNYGLILTLLSVLSVGPLMMGNALNNIRLLRDHLYIENNQEGDFNILLFVLGLISILVISITFLYYDLHANYSEIILLSFLSLLMLFQEYYIVTFRLIINYINIVKCNILQVVGFVIGISVYKIYRQWELIYILGYLASLIFIFRRSSLWKEKLAITPLFKSTSIEQLCLMVANFFNRFIDYADRIILFPLLGGEAVSVYYVAICSTKMVLLLVNPLNSVMLTYLAKWKENKTNVFNKVLLTSFTISVLIYFICILASKPILQILYPQYVIEAMKYILITTAIAAVCAITSAVNPFVMRFCSMKWQLVTSVGTVVFYLSICLYLLKLYGLYGFCIGVLISNVFKLLLRLVIYYSKIGK